MIARLYFLLLALALIHCSGDDSDSSERALHYLWSKQSPDGGWHSKTHGIMKSGESLTPFILNTLISVPREEFNSEENKIKKGLRFIRNSIKQKIAEEENPLILDYPTYTAAYQLKCLHSATEIKLENKDDKKYIDFLTEFLIAGQFTEQRGITPDHGAYGGWGFGETNLNEGEVGHVDLSHTRRVLEALALVLSKNHDVFKKAKKYLENVQNPDGGFFTSLVTTETNKSTPANLSDYSNLSNHSNLSNYKSYATATCDGLLALRACGFSVDHPKVYAALNWLKVQNEIPEPQGVDLDDPDQWHRVMQYYHLAVRAEVYHRAEFHDPGFRKQVQLFLQENQRKDGSFLNPQGGLNKEDDPLLCTTFALIAGAFHYSAVGRG